MSAPREFARLTTEASPIEDLAASEYDQNLFHMWPRQGSRSKFFWVIDLFRWYGFRHRLMLMVMKGQSIDVDGYERFNRLMLMVMKGQSIDVDGYDR
jgi:hypothetical protein